MTFSPRPFAKSPLRGFSLLRSFFLLINGRSLRDGTRMKIRASTIFILVSSLAELGGKKQLHKNICSGMIEIYIKEKVGM